MRISTTSFSVVAILTSAGAAQDGGVETINTIVPIEDNLPSKITTLPTPPQLMATTKKPAEAKTAAATTSTTEPAAQSSLVMPPPESTKTLFSTTIITEKPAAEPETSKASTQRSTEPSQSVVPYVTGDANSLRDSIRCTALALMGVLGVFVFACLF
ncbi:hypothetical protein BKA65DRAFT_472676 [Rhexocercosporidium sp. MPI-PUGE-AT-0058]|nr:hypothetical protein BKA65DRAFT_472676 [Rhexocercosporidium sp. MPI-PUGE-AT-0058]